QEGRGGLVRYEGGSRSIDHGHIGLWFHVQAKVDCALPPHPEPCFGKEDLQRLSHLVRADAVGRTWIRHLDDLPIKEFNALVLEPSQFPHLVVLGFCPAARMRGPHEGRSGQGRHTSSPQRARASYHPAGSRGSSAASEPARPVSCAARASSTGSCVC